MATKMSVASLFIFTVMMTWHVAKLSLTPNETFGKIAVSPSNAMSENNIAFDLPDLTATIPTSSGEYQLEAFKSVNNDAIILEGKQSSKISQLSWVSAGQPRFVETLSTSNTNVTKLFHFSRTTVYTYVEMMSPSQRKLLAETAEIKYGVKVSSSQIVNLILSQFECTLPLFDPADNKYILKGRVKDFRHFPLRMDFMARPGSYERKLFLEQLRTSVKDGDMPTFDCYMASTGKRTSTNTLTITAAQLDSIGLEDKLFGPSGTHGRDTVYVTRNQMTAIAAEMYTTLNIVEEYQMPETQFSEAFTDGLINQIAVNVYTPTSVDAAVATLSGYGLNFEGDLTADQMKRDLGEILIIEKKDAKSRIVLDNAFKEKLEQSQKNSGDGSGKVSFLKTFGATASAKWANENAKTNDLEVKSLNDQLNELNTLSQKDIKWMIEGNKVIPKSIDVARVARYNLAKTLSFRRVRRTSFEAPFQREFELDVYREKSTKSGLDQLMLQIAALEGKVKEQVEDLIKFSNQSQQGIAQHNARLQQISHDISTSNNRLQESSNSWSAQFQQSTENWNSQFQQLSTSLQSATRSVGELSRQAIKRCRVCFWESEGSSQCQGNRNSCSAWSDAPGWTAGFRDDTDNRGGGCSYQWKLECQT